MSHSINEEYTFNAPVTFNVLPVEFVGTLTGTTPSVKGGKRWKGKGSVVTVTNFLYGAAGQEIKVLGDGATTVSHNTKIKTNTAANKLLATNKVYTFTLFDNVWIENA